MGGALVQSHPCHAIGGDVKDELNCTPVGMHQRGEKINCVCVSACVRVHIPPLSTPPTHLHSLLQAYG